MSVTSIKIGNKPSISVDYSGQGEMVLFLHGIGGNKKNWKNNISFFSKKFLSVAWDTRGYGESDDYDGELDFDDVLDDLKKVIDFFDKYPIYVKTLTLCDTHFGLSNLSPDEIKKFINLRKEPLLKGQEPKDIAPAVASTLIGDINNRYAYEELVKSISLLHKESYLKTIETSMRTEHRHIFKNIKVPTFIMVGDLDTLTPPSMAKNIMNEIKGSYLKIIPNAGHLINIEEPKIFNENLMLFLEENS